MFFSLVSAAVTYAALLFSVPAAPAAPNTPFIAVSTSVPSCSSIARSQIEAALGQLLDAGTEEHSKFGSICTWSSADVSVTISVQHLTESLNISSELGKLQASFPGSEVHEVKGLAERAYALEIPEAGTQLHILPDEREYFMVSVLGVDGGHHGFDAAAKIAQVLLGRR